MSKRSSSQAELDSPAEPLLKHSKIDFEGQRAKTEQDVQDDLTTLGVKLTLLKAEENTVLRLRSDNKTVVFTYIGNRTPVSEPLKWTTMSAPIKTWTDKNYAKKAGTNLRWEISVLEGDLSAALENAFPVELEDHHTSEMKEFSRRIIQFIEAYPHVNYPTYAVYLDFISQFFLERGFAEKDIKSAFNLIITQRTKWQSFEKYKTQGEKVEAVLMSPAVLNLSKIRTKAIDAINQLTDPTHAATRKLLEFLNSTVQ